MIAAIIIVKKTRNLAAVPEIREPPPFFPIYTAYNNVRKMSSKASTLKFGNDASLNSMVSGIIKP
jgi:hypothetical protein